ncbi:hypothetical protein HHI36_001861 [Cryptolaemus montrouzieri]|uniref:Uncharacterized protein n=1 Tax=Cryptolaemus montrouzieri TaxID=559131 RepID=A0ABD2P8U1_9CUCU
MHDKKMNSNEAPNDEEIPFSEKAQVLSNMNTDETPFNEEHNELMETHKLDILSFNEKHAAIEGDDVGIIDNKKTAADQQNYYVQQKVGGQPVYVYGTPPPPDQGGRMPAYRSGEETRQARQERQNRRFGGFFNNDDDEERYNRDEGRIFSFDTVQIRNQFIRKFEYKEKLKLFIVIERFEKSEF